MLAARALPPEQARLLELGMMPADEAVLKLDSLTELINCRTDHMLEGWRQAGHYVSEWRLGPMAPWQPAQRLLDFQGGEAMAISELIAMDPSLKRLRPLSPREVFDAGASGLARMPLHIAAVFLSEVPPSTDAERPVKRGLIEFQNDEISSEPMVYGHSRRDGRGVNEPLRDGDKYVVRVNPLDTRYAWLYQSSGAFAGVAPRYDRVYRDDPKALTRAYAEKRQALAPLLAEARTLARQVTRQATERATQNTAILTAKRRKVQEFSGSNEELLDMPAAAESTENELSAEALL
jgi:hypothetical protein